MRNSYRVKTQHGVNQHLHGSAGAAILLNVRAQQHEVVSTVSAEASGGERERGRCAGQAAVVAAGRVKVVSPCSSLALPVNARNFNCGR